MNKVLLFLILFWTVLNIFLGGVIGLSIKESEKKIDTLTAQNIINQIHDNNELILGPTYYIQSSPLDNGYKFQLYNEDYYLVFDKTLTDRYLSDELVLIIINYIIVCITMFIYLRMFQNETHKNENMNDEYLYTLVNMIEKRDAYTAGHTQRVADYAILIGQTLKLTRKNLEILYKSCMLHDIGKIAIPDSILLKPGKLNNIEYAIIQEHSEVGYELLSTISSYKEIAKIVKYHHERLDGSGYPDGLKGDEIPLLSQIIAVADTFDAMTTSRIYKKKNAISDAIMELEHLQNKFYRTDVVTAAVKVLSRIEFKEDFSQLPQSKLEEERFVYFYKDPISNAFNKEYLGFLISNKEMKPDLVEIANIKLHHFNAFNIENGWDAGDKLLNDIATILKINNMVFRIHGDNFIIIADKIDYSFKSVLKHHLNKIDVEYRLIQFKKTFKEMQHIQELELILSSDLNKK